MIYSYRLVNEETKESYGIFETYLSPEKVKLLIGAAIAPSVSDLPLDSMHNTFDIENKGAIVIA